MKTHTHNTMVSVRMPAALAADLQALAVAETARRGEPVTVGHLLREGARRVVRLAKQRHRSPTPT